MQVASFTPPALLCMLVTMQGHWCPPGWNYVHILLMHFLLLLLLHVGWHTRYKHTGRLSR